MPTWDWVCADVRSHKQVEASKDPGPCQDCGAPMRRVPSVPGVVFKGSGWARKDR